MVHSVDFFPFGLEVAYFWAGQAHPPILACYVLPLKGAFLEVNEVFTSLSLGWALSGSFHGRARPTLEDDK